ncbi:protein aurora borealis [Nasonia vitripennis]|uniref:Protein aurora borealis n=1 Tax=Nasonia vitripennis TaxID=7425 RepID=A0A7M6UER0_NASVI|nr:protein aurora borealis [Nasonia vitripennis]
MDHSKWTPSKNKINCESIVMLSPITKTPVRQNDFRLRTSFQSSTSNFSVLPTHITPPSGLAKFIARNPFDADLTNKLHISVMSPSVFSKVVTPSQKSSPGFMWSIDEIALIQPAKIDEFPIQQMHCSDPEIEKHAQEAISRFFSENQIHPSPHDVKRNEVEKRAGLTTPTRAHDSINVSRESYKSKKEKRDSWTQTVLSLPPELPPNVEEALKPYFNFTQDQNCENEEANSSNNSLRRKLFSNHDDSQDESNSSIDLSPVKSDNPLIHNLSPPQTGMFFHGTPLRSCSQIVQRTFGTPLAERGDLSPCNVSPISNPAFNMSCQSIKSKNKSVTRLDFTKDMSIEISAENDEKENKRSPENEINCKTLFSDEIKLTEKKTYQYHLEAEKDDDITHMVVSENSLKFKFEDKENFALNNFNIHDKSKFTEIGKLNFSESYALQQSNMLSGNYIQQLGFGTAHQDTGYQTYSSSNLTSNMDSYSTSIKQKLHWEDKTAPADDEVQLSDWKDNMKNMISSTPSKYNRGIHHL